MPTDFLAQFSATLEHFCVEEGGTQEEFAALVRTQTDADSDSWSSDEAFVGLIMAFSEYPAFLNMMRSEARDCEEEISAGREGKGGK